MTDSNDAKYRERILRAEVTARVLVQAGPGTGKTELAALRMANLIRGGVSAGQILVLSFSRSAVRNLTQRLERVAAPDTGVLDELRHVSIRTFDSWAFRILRLLGHAVPDLLAKGHDENIAALTALITGPERTRIRTLAGDRRHLIVDEFQDLPGVRGELVLALLDLLAPSGRPGAGFTVLGDPAQAIYGFAARYVGRAFPTPAEYWRRITDTYGTDLEIVALTHNYRSAGPLARLSSSLRTVLLGPGRDAEKLETVREALTSLPAAEEPVGPSWLDNRGMQDRAILTRTNGESLRALQRLFGMQVEGGKTPVRLRAGSHKSLPPAWVAALLGPLRSSELTRSRFSRIYDHLTKDWDDATQRALGLPSEQSAWSRLARASGAPEGATAFQVNDLRFRLDWPDAFPDDELIAEDGVVVTTIHQSKGLEFDVVTVVDSPQDAPRPDIEGSVPDSASILEEANVLYVAVTRAVRELNRIDGNSLYEAPRSYRFRCGRVRLRHWQRGWMNLEMGLGGDIDPFGFVDPQLHGGTGPVAELQDLLLRNASSLQGHKVMLVKHHSRGKAVWNVHLQEGSRPARLIGRTATQLTHDLLDMLYHRGIPLPRRIMNLRIAGVGTVSSNNEFPLGEPYRTSRLWLGFSLFGTGDFKTRRE